MDNLTHSLVGALLGQAGLKKKTGLAMPALIIGANLPDIDAACFFWLEGQEHLGFRRGITHGPPALVLLPLILAALLWAFDRWQTKRGKRPEGRLPVHFGWLFALSFIGCLTHPALDWLNVYGIRLLEPFSSQWFYGDTLFIIDVWLWALLAVSVWWSMRKQKRGGNWTKPAWIGLIVGLSYIGMNGAITNSLVARESQADVIGGEREVIASPVPLWFWQRETIIGEDGRYQIFSPEIEHLDNARASDEEYEQHVSRVGDCALDPAFAAAKGNSQAEAFLFWARTLVADRAEDGSVILRDARFYDPLLGDRFSLALSDVECEELPAD
ncbi:MAG: metal-dependent hydrolase [Pseudomonadota bacterium]